MPERDVLVTEFEQNRAHLRAVAYRMLGSLSEADDAVQESWLHVSRSGTAGVKNLGGWLTTVVARVCLDMLRSRRARREEPLDGQPPALPIPVHGANGASGDPEQEALLADSVGPALLVVLEELAPAERLAFVLHDMFAVPFDEIAPIVGRSPAAARQLASRARRRVQGSPSVPDADLTRQRELVSAFMAASRDGDFEALLAVLDPDVVLRADRATVPAGRPTLLRGAEHVARGAMAGRSRFAQAALVDGAVGIVVAPRGQLTIALTFSFGRGRITEIEVIADPERLRDLDVAVLDG
ncbi:MAG TPA: sigma-70 family RNA polymerase sigma factor [Streptosporangiaceae bacterium]